MPKNVIFNLSVSGADAVIVTIQGVQVSPGPLSCHFVKTMNDNVLNVEIDISAPTGTSYTITYSCTSDGISKSDPGKSSPINGTIQHFNGKTERLTIPL